MEARDHLISSWKYYSTLPNGSKLIERHPLDIFLTKCIEWKIFNIFLRISRKFGEFSNEKIDLRQFESIAWKTYSEGLTPISLDISQSEMITQMPGYFPNISDECRALHARESVFQSIFRESEGSFFVPFYAHRMALYHFLKKNKLIRRFPSALIRVLFGFIGMDWIISPGYTLRIPSHSLESPSDNIIPCSASQVIFNPLLWEKYTIIFNLHLETIEKRNINAVSI